MSLIDEAMTPCVMVDRTTLDRATAEACLKMVELYVNSNGVNVMVDKLESGELKFYYEPFDGSNGAVRNA